MKIYIEHNEALYPIDIWALSTAVDDMEFEIRNGNEIHPKNRFVEKLISALNDYKVRER